MEGNRTMGKQVDLVKGGAVMDHLLRVAEVAGLLGTTERFPRPLIAELVSGSSVVGADPFQSRGDSQCHSKLNVLLPFLVRLDSATPLQGRPVESAGPVLSFGLNQPVAQVHDVAVIRREQA